MNEPTDWLSAIGILLSGVVLGVMFIYVYVKRRQNTAAVPAKDLELAELEAKRDALIQQLRELDDSGDATPEERKRLELKTADVLRAIDGFKPSKGKAAVSTGAAPVAATASTVPAPTGFFARNPAVKGFVFGVGSVAALAFLGWFVYHSAQSREQGSGMTGGQGMGQQQPMAAQPQQPPNPAVQQLEAAVQASPDDVDKRIDLARAYLDSNNMMGVFEQTKAVLEKHPDEPRALAYNAIVRMTMGQLDDAKKMLEKASKTDPSITDAWVALAWIATRSGKNADADAAIASAVKAHPEQEAKLKEVLAEMRGQAMAKATPLPPGAENQPLPPNHPQIDPSAMGTPATAMANAAAGSPLTGTPAKSVAPAPDAVHVTLNVDPKAAAKSGIVYVFARPAGQAVGAPIAVKRLVVASFPVQLDFSSADSMMGDPLPPKMHLEARLSSTGDVAVKTPTDPRGVLDGVATKSTVTLTLK